MDGVDNPVAKTLEKIEHQRRDITDKQVHLFQDDSDLNSSVHKNYNTIYNTMYKGTTEMKHSSIEEERAKQPENIKDMGKMSHRDSNESVRKQETQVGNLSHVQAESQINLGTVEEAIAQSRTVSKSHLDDLKKKIAAKVEKGQQEINKQKQSKKQKEEDTSETNELLFEAQQALENSDAKP